MEVVKYDGIGWARASCHKLRILCQPVHGDELFCEARNAVKIVLRGYFLVKYSGYKTKANTILGPVKENIQSSATSLE